MIVVDNLFGPIILSMPFYKLNNLVIDPVVEALLDRRTGRNILDDDDVPAPLPRPLSKRERQESQYFSV